MPLNEAQMLHFKKSNFEVADNAGHSYPKTDKVVEWSLLTIVELLTAINTHLARLAARQ